MAELNDDAEAWAILSKGGFTDNKGFIHPPSPEHVMTREEADAVDYLCSEWDYAWEGSNGCECHPKEMGDD